MHGGGLRRFLGVCSMEGDDYFRSEVTKLVGYPIGEPALFRRAFTHKSAVQESIDSYDRTEFLGDSCINLIVGKLLFDMYPSQNEGFLTQMRTKLVSGTCLAQLARHLHLDRFVIMDSKAMNNGWNQNARILEDIFEALIGAIMLDSGIHMANAFMVACIRAYVDFSELMVNTNAKDALMRYTQAHKLPLPVYHMHESSTARNYEVTTFVDGAACGYGAAPLKKQAQQLAAKGALQKLGVAY